MTEYIINRQHWNSDGGYSRIIIIHPEGAGACIADINDNKDSLQAWFSSLMVDEAYRGQGIATEMITLMEDILRRMNVEVINLQWLCIDSEDFVLDWYKRLGFKVAALGDIGAWLYKEIK